MRIVNIALLLFVMLLTGCATPEQFATKPSKRIVEARRVAGEIRQSCRAYGFREGTDVFAGCIQNEVHALEAARQTQARQQR